MQTETEVLSCAPTRNIVSTPIYGGVEVKGPKPLHALVSQTAISIMPTLASVCTRGGPLQMVKISKHSAGNLKVMRIRGYFH